MGQLNLKILTMEGVKFDGSVQFISVPGADGQLTILPSHAALLTSLQPGEVVIHTNDGEHYISVAGGVMEISNDQVAILADAAERDTDIDIQRAEAALTRAREQVSSVKRTVDVESATRALARAQIRIKVASHRKHSIRATRDNLAPESATAKPPANTK